MRSGWKRIRRRATAGDQARAGLAQRIRSRVESPMRVHTNGDRAVVAVAVGASIGFCTFSGAATAPLQIIHCADAEMYRDKAAPRRRGNQVNRGQKHGRSQSSKPTSRWWRMASTITMSS